MKKNLVFTLFVLAGMAVYAQPGGGFQRQTPQERVAAIHAKLDSAFKLEPSRLATLDTALTVLYTKQDEKMRELFTGGERPDRDAMQALMKQYSDARDEMIKAVVSEEQYVTWKEKLEPSMRPQGGRGGGMRPRDNR